MTVLPVAAQPPPCPGGVCVVTTEAELRSAITSVNAFGGTILLANNITLTANLPAAIDLSVASVTFDGGGFTLSGNNQYQGLSFTNSSANFSNTATLQNLTITNAVAAGGAGVSDGTGGGGGAGAGGALFIGAAASVTASNVNLVSNNATGGAGGTGSGAFANGGAGGGLNTGGTGGGGAGGIGGFTTPSPGTAGAYGQGGGGAGVGFGGLSGAAGGFGGGAGGSSNGLPVAGGFGGGSNGGSFNGGGGAGFGGGVFIEQQGQLTVSGPFTVNGNAVTGGASGGGAAAPGSAEGGGLYFESGFLDVNTNSDLTVADSIGGSASIQKSGTGTLVLGGNSTFTGGVNVSQGTLSISADANLGTAGGVSLSSGTTLAITASGTYTHDIQLAIGLPATLNVTGGQTATWNGVFRDGDVPPSTLNVAGGGTLVLGNSANSYSGGTIVTGNSTVSVGADGALGNTLGNVTLGDPTTRGTLSFQNGSAFTTTRNVTLGTGGGVLDAVGTADVDVSGAISGSGSLDKTGTGTITLSGANTYTGATNVDAGTLRAGSSGVFNPGGTMQVNSGATLDLNGFTQTVGSLSGGGTVALGSATLFAGIDNSSTTFSGTIGGTGGFEKDGTGTLTLTGTNTYSGGTTVSGGTLLGTTDSLQGNIANNATVGFSQNTNGTYTGAMSGTGQLTKDGSGTVTLAGANTYSGGTVVTGGILAGDSTSLQGTIVNNSQVQFTQAGNGAYTGTMSGTGSLVKDGAGTLALTGPNTYSGGTLVSGGLLVGDSISLQGLIVNNAQVEFNQTGNGTYAGEMNGTGSLVKSGAGTLTLTGPNSYAGGTTISAGTLVGDTTSLQGAIVNDATLGFSQSGSGTYAGNISGTGTVLVSGGGTVAMTGTNTYTGGTTVSGSTLLGTTDSLQGGITNNGSVGFVQSTNGTYTGVMSGTGQLTKDGSGTVTLSGANTYSGGTVVTGGILAGDTTSLQGTILNNSQVQFNELGNGTYAGVMSGSGSLVKNGAGTLTLTGANLFTGGTLINAGTLVASTASLQGNITDNASLIFNQTADGVMSGGLFGTGSFTKTGAGTLTIAGSSFFSGDTTISGGTLAMTAGSMGGSIVDNATLLFNQPTSGTFNGTISGTGSLVKTGGGTLTLGGANSYTGGTTVSAGILAGTTSSLQGAILNNGQVLFNQGTNGTYAGGMSGTGSLFKSGAGTLTLTGVNTYSGGTTVAGGAISLASDAALGATQGGVSLGDAFSSGTLLFTNAGLFQSSRAFQLGSAGGIFDTAGLGLVTLGGSIDGAGGLTKAGAGTLVLAGPLGYTGATTILAGSLQTGAANVFSSTSALSIAPGTSLNLNGFSQTIGSLSGNGDVQLGSATLTTGGTNTSSVFGGTMSGSGSLVKTGGGTLTLTGVNTYTGGTSVLGGALVGTTTSIQGNIFNNSLVQFSQNADGTYAGSMSGTGVLAKTGSGVLTLSGTNSYAGGTIIDGGSIIGSATSLQGRIVNNSSLTFGGTADGVFNGILSGRGSLTKVGTGTLTMTGAQAGTGLLNIAQGTLILDGTYAGDVTVGTGASLRATGSIGGSLNLGGSLFALPPGSLTSSAASGGHAIENAPYFTVINDLSGTSGSTMDFAIGAGTTPTVLVGGSATFNGSRFNISAPSIGTLRSESFLALSALNGLAFQDTTITTSDPNVEPILNRSGNNLFVTLVNLNVPLAGTVNSPISTAIDENKKDATGDAAFVIRELTALDDQHLKDAIEQISGQIHASVVQNAIIDAEMLTDLIRDQLQSRQEEGANDVRWWGETACQRANYKDTAAARGGNSTVCTGAGGLDTNLSEHWTIGGGGSWSNGSMSLGGPGGKGDYQSPRAFGYAGYQPKAFGIRMGGSVAHSSYQTERQIQFQATLPQDLGGQPISEGVNRTAQSDQKGSTSDVWNEYHDSVKIGTYTLEGLFGLRRARISRSAFSETGAISLSLNGVDEILKLTQTDVKVHLWRRSGTIRPFFDSAYRRELTVPESTAELSLSGLPKTDFQVPGIGVPVQTVSIRAGATLALRLGQATLAYEYKKATDQQRQTVGLRFRFR